MRSDVISLVTQVIVFYVHFDDWRLAATAFISLTFYGYVTVRVTLWRKKFRQATNKHDNDYHDKATDRFCVHYRTIPYHSVFRMSYCLQCTILYHATILWIVL